MTSQTLAVPTCTADAGRTWKRCTRHGVYPDNKCHLHTDHLDGTHVERSRVDAERQRAHNDGRVVHIEREFVEGVIGYLNDVLGAFEGDPEPSELLGKDIACRLISELLQQKLKSTATASTFG